MELKEYQKKTLKQVKHYLAGFGYFKCRTNSYLREDG